MTRILTITRRAFAASPGSELRLRGKWLYDLGWKPGMRVEIRPSWPWSRKTLSLRLLPRADKPKKNT